MISQNSDTKNTSIKNSPFLQVNDCCPFVPVKATLSSIRDGSNTFHLD